MTLLTRIKSFLRGEWLPGGELPPKLRNRPGSMAYINSAADEGGGTGDLVGRIVMTTRVMIAPDMWAIDPPQKYTATARMRSPFSGAIVRPGDVATCTGMRDCALTPIPDTGISSDEVQHLYSTQPDLVPLRVRGEVS